MRIPLTLLVLLIRGYQRLISPVLPSSCRFAPSCSEYAIEALTRRGLVTGSLLTIHRLLRCHPLCKGGYDPVPRAPLGRTHRRPTHRAITAKPGTP